MMLLPDVPFPNENNFDQLPLPWSVYHASKLTPFVPEIRSNSDGTGERHAVSRRTVWSAVEKQLPPAHRSIVNQHPIYPTHRITGVGIKGIAMSQSRRRSGSTHKNEGKEENTLQAEHNRLVIGV